MPIMLCPVWCSLSKFLLSFFLIVLYFLGEILFIPVEQGWVNILARGPHFVFKTDRRAGPSVDEVKNKRVQSTKYMLNLFPFSHFLINKFIFKIKTDSSLMDLMGSVLLHPFLPAHQNLVPLLLWKFTKLHSSVHQ